MGWAVVASLATLFLSTGCSAASGGAGVQIGGAASRYQTASNPTEGQRAIATAIAARAAPGSDQAGKPPGAPKVGAATVAEIMASAPTSPLLDGRHLVARVGCESCHGALPADRTPALPSTAGCLSCHGGSYDGLAAKTSALGGMNPHKSHVGRLDCGRCHRVHRAFEYSCNTCHSFPVPERFGGWQPGTMMQGGGSYA